MWAMHQQIDVHTSRPQFSLFELYATEEPFRFCRDQKSAVRLLLPKVSQF